MNVDQVTAAESGTFMNMFGSGELSLRRVKRAYEQIADQLRELILVGKLKPGTKLPIEVDFASHLGVSRSTVREALRQLSAEGLVRTSKGTGGGSYVSRPSLDRISAYLSTNISLLSNAAELSLAQFLEARELFEVPATRLAAERASNEDRARLCGSVPGELKSLSTEDQFVWNREFHSTIIDACANPLISLAAAPIFLALQTRLARTQLDDAFHEKVNEHHREIARMVENYDGDGAADAMLAHLQWLRPAYERAWRSFGEEA